MATEQDEQEQPEEQPRQLAPPPTTSQDKKENTVSLLDLMREMGDPSSPVHDVPEEPDLPAPLVVRPEDIESAGERPAEQGEAGEATPTGLPVPEQLPRPEAPPLPLAAQELRPTTRPPIRDEDATKVQPRSAFPGQTQIEPLPPAARPPVAGQPRPRPSSDAPTQPPTARPPAPRQATAQSPQDRRPTTPGARQAAPTRPRPEPLKVVIPEETHLPRPQTRRQRRWTGCLSRLIITGIVVTFIGLVLAIAVTTIGYITIASQLPPPSELRSRASTFETARILDRNGQLLYALADPTTGNRTYVTLDEISQDLIDATIATEDSRFYLNPGFDPVAIARAVIQAAREGEEIGAAGGASTITQQLARALLLDPEERTQVTFSRKIKEIILAAEIYRTYPKDEILELYLNEIYYGNRAYGIEAAAQTYFDKPAAELTLPEASLLAGLPQAPALWDPYTAPESALGRQSEVLALMTQQGFVTAEEAQQTLDASALVVYAMVPPQVVIAHPHFIFTVLQQLEAEIGAQAIYRGGLRVYTTLDPQAQALAEETVAASAANVRAAGANNAALVTLNPKTGEVLALVGSLDFNNEDISGQVNMALAPRQPGSSIKPLVYLSAMEQGWTASTLIWDVPTQFPDGANPPYVPKNFDDQFHGPLRLRPALGNSYNIPAVKALEYVGVCAFVSNMQKVGLASLQDAGCQEVGQPRNYGLSLALGGGEISPLEMAGAFAVLANQGQYRRPFTISRIENRAGEQIFTYEPPADGQAQVVRPELAYILSHILSDNNARIEEFGANNRLVIAGHRVAVKTGTSGTTSSDVRDGWTIGYTPEVVTAVWVGNTDNQPVGQGQSGYQMATPIWNSFMTSYLASRTPVDFVRPPGIVEAEICADSGTRPGPGCASRTVEVFASDQPPLESNQDFLRPAFIDLWTNQIANEFCTESVYEANFFNLLVSGRPEVQGRETQNAQQWLEQTGGGRAWAQQRNIGLPLRLPPQQACDQNTPRPQAVILQPRPSESVEGNVEIRGIALAPNYAGFIIDYGLSHDPQGWGSVQDRRMDQVDNGLLAMWDTSLVEGGPVTLRLTIFGPDNPYTEGIDPVSLESRATIFVVAATPTATMSPTPTETSTPTGTATIAPTTPPSSEVTATPTPSATPPLTETPTPTVTPGGSGG